MSLLAASAVDFDALWRTVVAAFVAGIGTTLIFALAVLGAARFTDASRDGRAAEAAVFGVLAILGALATLAAVVAAVIVMTHK